MYPLATISAEPFPRQWPRVSSGLRRAWLYRQTAPSVRVLPAAGDVSGRRDDVIERRSRARRAPVSSVEMGIEPRKLYQCTETDSEPIDDRPGRNLILSSRSYVGVCADADCGSVAILL